jgi:hypothetical protein
MKTSAKRKEIASILRCSRGLVNKVVKKYEGDPNTIPTPKKNGGHGNRAHLFKHYLPVVKDFVDGGIEVKNIAAHLTDQISPSFYPSTVYRHTATDLKKSLQKGKKVDPRKFSDENMEYYLDYTLPDNYSSGPGHSFEGQVF